MKTIHTILLLGGLLPAQALAQDPSRQHDATQQEQKRQDDLTKAQRSGAIDLRKGAKVIGADIHRGYTAAVPPAGEEHDDRKAGEKLGEIEHLIVRASDGSIPYAVVSLDEGLDTGSKLFALPFEVLKPQMSTDMDRLVFDLNVDAERLRGAPSFDDDKWPDLSTGEALRNVDDFFRDTVRNLQELARRDEVGTQPAGARREQQPFLLRFDKVRGCQVDTSSGKDAGEIEELAVDVHNGAIAFALLSTGGFLGLGEDHHAVPWKAFDFTMKVDEDDPKDQELVCRLNIPESQLENAPKYDKSDWKKVNDSGYLERVYTHYGATPYWRHGSASEAGQTEGRTTDPNQKPGGR